MPNSSSWRSEPRAFRTVAAALIAAAALACATPGATEVRTDLDAIQQQLWTIQKENAALLEQVRTLEKTRAAAPVADQGAAETRLRLDTLERDLRVLQARLLDSEQRLGAAVQDLRTTREAIEVLARSPAAGLPAAAPVAAIPVVPAPAAAPPPVEPAAPGAPLLEDLYRQGYADYSKGNYSLAQQELVEFVKRNPASALADDAQYLVGEVLLAQEKYPEAIGAFEEVIQRYGSGDKVPAAYLKKGLALLELNRTSDAVIQLQHVVTAYPRTEEARIARERLRALGLRER